MATNVPLRSYKVEADGEGKKWATCLSEARRVLLTPEDTCWNGHPRFLDGRNSTEFQKFLQKQALSTTCLKLGDISILMISSG